MDEILSRECTLRINVNTTKVTVCNKHGKSSMNLLLSRKKIEEVRELTYLGSKFTKDGKSKRELIKQAVKVAFNSNWKLLTSKEIPLGTRTGFFKSYVWSAALYGLSLIHI